MTPLSYNLWLSRAAGFGPTPDLLHARQRMDVAELLPHEPPQPVTVVTPEAYAALQASDDTPQARRKALREQTLDLGRTWMAEMATTAAPLREKAALFWHGHFATRIENPLFDQQLLQVFRTHALGPFKDLLLAVSQSAAMLRFLNNNQNRKGHPNENFAREVMELFTVGRGHYTETDIREAARAFTGWNADAEGQFQMRRNQHDDGEKTVFGNTGRFDGTDVLQMLADRHETADFLTAKAWKFFVSDALPDARTLRRLAATYRKSGLNFSVLLRALLTPGHATAAGTRIKSPVELLVGYQRLAPLEFQKPQTLVLLQRALGQLLFFPPNVGGWPAGRAWIDSSSLALRMRLPEALYGSGELDLHPNDPELEGTDASQPARRYRLGKDTADWAAWEAAWRDVPASELPRRLAAFLLPVPPPDATLQAISRYADRDSRTDWLRTITIRLLGVPEYQLA